MGKLGKVKKEWVEKQETVNQKTVESEERAGHEIDLSAKVLKRGGRSKLG